MKDNRKPLGLMKYIPVLVIILILFCFKGRTQELKADSTKFYIGSEVNVILEIPFNQGDIINFPSFSDTLTSSIEILSKSIIDTVIIEGSSSKLLRQSLSITSFDTGFIVVPPLIFDVTRQGSISEKMETKPLMLEVVKVKVDPNADIKDIKPIIKAPYTFSDFLPWIIGFLILAAIIFGIRYYINQRKKAPLEKPTPKITRPAWVITLEQLEALKTEQLWQKGQIKEYYTKLTDILREYFESRFEVNAAEMTSSEIIEAMRPLIKESEPMEALKTLLFYSDMAKFAKAQPGVYENEQSMNYGFEIVNRTKSQGLAVESK